MSAAVVIRGRYVNQTFIPDEPLPQVEGPAELIVITPATPLAPSPSPRSSFDAFGMAPKLRSLEDIEAQLRDNREE